MSTPTSDRRPLLAAGAAIALAVAASVYAQVQLWTWYIEDAAISFSYARNLAEGWGLARFPGDERVEGYSNPLWVAWMALWERLGIDAWSSSKWTGLALAGVTVPAVFAATRRVGGLFFGVVAAFAIGLDAQFVIWSASGLENSLFCALMALGLASTAAETGVRFRVAVLFWLALSVTRPEGIVYAAIGGFWALVLEATGERRWGRILAWLVVFFVPFGLYHAVRYDYFAHAFPATYYAKIGEDPFRWATWNARGWTYLRDYGLDLGRFWLSPLVLLGVTGGRGWRGALTLVLSVVLAVVLLYPGVEPFIEWGWIDAVAARPSPTWVTVRLCAFAGILVATTLAGVGVEGWRTRLLSWIVLVVGLALCLRSQGDWMRGYRWLSLLSVPSVILLCLGVRDLYTMSKRLVGGRFGSTLGEAVGGGLVALAVIGIVVPQVRYLQDYRPETTPYSVRGRVRHYADAMLRLHMDRADILDHDMGAMMWWGRDLGVVRDTKGLIDIAFARHRRQRRFVLEYAFEEYPFDLAHAHGSTGPAVRTAGKRWSENYIEMPGYGGGRSLHVANFVRKSAIMAPWSGTRERTATFRGSGRRVDLLGLDLPAGEAYAGGWLYLEFGLQVRGEGTGTRLMVFLHDQGQVAHTWHLALGLDHWYPVEDWTSGEIQNARIAVPVPRSLAKGDYGIGVAVLGPDGFLAADDASPEPVFAVGEKRYDNGLQITGRGRVDEHRKQWIARAIARADDDRCEDAVEAWWLARARRAMNPEWLAENRAMVGVPIGRCFARRSEAADRPTAVAMLRRAREWAPTDPEVLGRGAALAEPWMVEADRLRERAETLSAPATDAATTEAAPLFEQAYDLYRDVLFVDPSRAWARRYAEDLRIIRLNLRH